MKAKYVMRNFHLSNQKRKELYKSNKLINRKENKETTWEIRALLGEQY
jgi:hypothetical protein